jgi:ATP-dependent DNA helicase UvrD/PcrA
MNTVKWSPSTYQQAFFDFVRDGKGHGILEAVAGSGKTTTVVKACEYAPPGARILFVAFNKPIAVELSKRVPSNTEAKTLHGLGFGAVKRAWGQSVQMIEDRELNLASDIVPQTTSHETLRQLVKLVSMGKAWLTEDPQGLAGLADAYECWPQDMDPQQFVGYAKMVIEASKKTDDGAFSYDDMCWLPVALNMRVPQYDIVFIDETQDLNKCQIELALRAAGDKGRIMAVGDRRQAIYAFRGADSASMERLQERLNATVLPLSITYRCPKAVVKQANNYVKEFYAADTAIDGHVSDVTETDLLKGITPGDFVISRSNAPLASLCMKALRLGKRAIIKGKDMGRSLVKLVTSSKCYTVEEFSMWLKEYEIREMRRLNAAGKEKQVEALLDKVETLHVLCEGLQTTRELADRLNSLFEERPGAGFIIFSSTHKAKGLESDRVWLLWDTYRPGKSTEESNLAYVAVTRSKKELYLMKKSTVM